MSVRDINCHFYYYYLLLLLSKILHCYSASLSSAMVILVYPVTSTGVFPSNRQILNLLNFHFAIPKAKGNQNNYIGSSNKFRATLDLLASTLFVIYQQCEGVNQVDLNMVLMKKRNSLRHPLNVCYKKLVSKKRSKSTEEEFWNSNFDINLSLLHAGSRKEVGDTPLISVIVPEPTTATGPAVIHKDGGDAPLVPVTVPEPTTVTTPVSVPTSGIPNIGKLQP